MRTRGTTSRAAVERVIALHAELRLGLPAGPVLFVNDVILGLMFAASRFARDNFPRGRRRPHGERAAVVALRGRRQRPARRARGSAAACFGAAIPPGFDAASPRRARASLARARNAFVLRTARTRRGLNGYSHASRHPPRASSERWNHRAHRRWQDDLHRAHSPLHRRDSPLGRGPSRRHRAGLHASGARDGHHHLVGGDLRRVDALGRQPRRQTALHQPHRHARARRLHHRGRAVSARARRRRRALRRQERGRASVGDGVAPGRSPRRAAPRLHQQDGQAGRLVRGRRRLDPRAPRRRAGARPAPRRGGGRAPRRDRSRPHARGPLRRSHRRDLRRRRDPGRAPRAAERARAELLEACADSSTTWCSRSSSPDAQPRSPRSRSSARSARACARGASWWSCADRPQKQGDPAAPRRRLRLPAVAARRGARARRRGRDVAGDRHDRGRRGAAGRARVQGHEPRSRRLGHAAAGSTAGVSARARSSTTRAPASPSAWAGSSSCTARRPWTPRAPARARSPR